MPRQDPVHVDEILASRLNARGIRSRDISRNLDKAGLVRWHKAAEGEFQRMVRGSVSALLYRFMDPERPAAPIDNLKRLRLSQLNENVRKQSDRVCFQTEQVFYGKFCVNAFKTVGVLTVLEDEHGDAVLVVVENAVPTTASEDEVRARFPKGMQVAIREPVFRQLWTDGTVGLNVGNPADIVPIYESNDAQSRRLLSVGREGPLQFAVACRKEGNELFGRKLWNRAADAYKLGTALVFNSGLTELMEAENARELVPLNDQLTLLYSNSSEANLRLRSCKVALEDAEKSLAIKPSNAKSLMRKAKSLHGLQRYEDEIACLEALRLLQSPIAPEATIIAGMESARIAMRQRSGIYELDAFFENRKRSRDTPVPDCVQYVGPVELRIGSANGRRGLFATRRIKAGELLLVSKALVVGRRPKSGPVVYLAEAAGAFDDSAGDAPPTVLEGYAAAFDESFYNVLAMAIARAQESGRFAHQLYSLQGSQGKQEVPPLSLFTEDWEDDDNYPKVSVDVRRIREIVCTNLFRMNGTGTSTGSGDVELHSDACCLQGLGSFFNHSCSTNCNYEQVGDLMFVSSTRDIQAGAELTISYFKLFHTNFFRKVKMQRRHFPFQCDCPRCLLEEQAFQDVPALGALALKYNQKFELEDDPTDMSLNVFSSRKPSRPLVESAEIAFKVEAIMEGCPSFSQEQRDWIRCSFAISYLIPFLDWKSFGPYWQRLGNTPVRGRAKALPFDDVIRVLRSVEPGSSFIRTLFCLGYCGEIQTGDENIDAASEAYFTKLLEGWVASNYRPVRDGSIQKLFNLDRPASVETFISGV